ncbi:hypothetical protein [Agrobacterium rosae]|uniref:hypothetical protein n=1 Tax=Agrobacterium rosae TaxID=1972867 RepID=UPI000CD9E060|nr:hypothetical protein [Agrobacterium rosae]POO52130.1 hypothetical protein CTT39_21820 [Agrobacterium rosae]
MLFSIEYDSGDILEGYVIPDGFSEIASVRVSCELGDLGVFACDQIRPAVVQSGRHHTGVVGFRVDASRVPELASIDTLTIHEAKTGLLLYRRLRKIKHKPKKIVRLETQILPMTKFDRFCGQFFQYELSSLEKFGQETALQAFYLHSVESIFLSGRLLMKNYENVLNNGFEAIALLADPYYEMALRLFLLHRMSSVPSSILGDRDRLTFGLAAQYVAKIDITDIDALKNLFKKAPPQFENVLASPTTRQLCCTTPEKRVTHGDIAAALDLLSRFSVIGHGDDIFSFQNAVGELLSVSAENFVVPPSQKIVSNLAVLLREIPSAERLIEEDLILDHYVRQAMSPNHATAVA